jgi:hypothetical protein
MEENRFFRFAWRFNAVVFMFAGLLAIIVLCLTAFTMCGVRHRPNIVNIKENGRVEEKLRLGHAKAINSNQCLMVPLLTDQSYTQSHYGKSAQSVRNYLFVNTQTNERRWLLPGTKYLVLRDHVLNQYNQKGDDKIVEAILYEYVKHDTNNDKKLTESDAHAISLSSPSGEQFTELIDGIERMLGHFVTGDKRLLIVYQKDGLGHTSEISLVDFKVIRTEAFPEIP